MVASRDHGPAALAPRYADRPALLDLHSPGERHLGAVGRRGRRLLPALDALFGTLHPPRRQPVAFGIAADPVPSGLLAQLRYPFRSGS
jgi:hypothetical protein